MKTEKILSSIDKSRLPRHVAIIMDGNGRWAKQHFLPRIAGHHEGAKRVKPIVTAASRLGIQAVTFYSFSVENWSRPENEVSALMKILDKFLSDDENTRLFSEENVRFNVIGSIERLPDFARAKVEKWLEETKDNSGLVFTLALSYSSQEEIVSAIRRIAEKVKNTGMTVEEITKETVEENLMTNGLPPLDLVIRTSGEYRISNFLLWQSAYSEFHFTKTHWPAFLESNFYEAIIDYQKRTRRFGLTDEQISTAP